MAEKIIFTILSIPIIGLLIYSIKYPKEAYLLGRRWMYDEEPEISDEFAKLCKYSSILVLGIIIIIFIKMFI